MSDIFIEKEEKEQPEVKERKKETVKEAPPADYLPVKFSTLGKLSAPSKLHFRNYTGQDALNLSLANGENILQVLITTLNNMVYEKFDCAMLHLEEVQEVMLNIYFNFWSSVIEYDYVYDNDELDGLKEEKKTSLESGHWKPSIIITSDKIKTNTLPEDFKEPINIEYENKKVSFRLERIKDSVIAQEMSDEKFIVQDEKFDDIKKKIRKATDEGKYRYEYLTNKEVNSYEKYMEEKSNYYSLIERAQQIIKVNGKELETLDEKIEAYKNQIGLDFWQNLNAFLKELNFGVENDITVKSPLTGKNVTRRFQFQFLDFVPSMELQRDKKYTISFG
ncbi:MAG: hypothetical protein ACOC3V_00310 [bacterium]